MKPLTILFHAVTLASLSEARLRKGDLSGDQFSQLCSRPKRPTYIHVDHWETALRKEQFIDFIKDLAKDGVDHILLGRVEPGADVPLSSAAQWAQLDEDERDDVSAYISDEDSKLFLTIGGSYFSDNFVDNDATAVAQEWCQYAHKMGYDGVNWNIEGLTAKSKDHPEIEWIKTAGRVCHQHVDLVFYTAQAHSVGAFSDHAFEAVIEASTDSTDRFIIQYYNQPTAPYMDHRSIFQSDETFHASVGEIEARVPEAKGKLVVGKYMYGYGGAGELSAGTLVSILEQAEEAGYAGGVMIWKAPAQGTIQQAYFHRNALPLLRRRQSTERSTATPEPQASSDACLSSNLPSSTNNELLWGTGAFDEADISSGATQENQQQTTSSDDTSCDKAASSSPEEEAEGVTSDDDEDDELEAEIDTMHDSGEAIMSAKRTDKRDAISSTEEEAQEVTTDVDVNDESDAELNRPPELVKTTATADPTPSSTEEEAGRVTSDDDEDDELEAEIDTMHYSAETIMSAKRTDKTDAISSTEEEAQEVTTDVDVNDESEADLNRPLELVETTATADPTPSSTEEEAKGVTSDDDEDDELEAEIDTMHNSAETIMSAKRTDKTDAISSTEEEAQEVTTDVDVNDESEAEFNRPLELLETTATADPMPSSTEEEAKGVTSDDDELEAEIDTMHESAETIMSAKRTDNTDAISSTEEKAQEVTPDVDVNDESEAEFNRPLELVETTATADPTPSSTEEEAEKVTSEDDEDDELEAEIDTMHDSAETIMSAKRTENTDAISSTEEEAQEVTTDVDVNDQSKVEFHRPLELVETTATADLTDETHTPSSTEEEGEELRSDDDLNDESEAGSDTTHEAAETTTGAELFGAARSVSRSKNGEAQSTTTTYSPIQGIHRTSNTNAEMVVECDGVPAYDGMTHKTGEQVVYKDALWLLRFHSSHPPSTSHWAWTRLGNCERSIPRRPCLAPVWEAGESYPANTEVTLDGAIYRNNRYATPKNVPDRKSAQIWIYLDECDPQEK